MAVLAEFTKAKSFRGVGYKKGDTLSVSDSIFREFKARGDAKVYKPKKKSDD